ncbi:MAG: hypothetical protein RLZZ628_2104 [Bacteroidota bacterium]|jgi:hypothetical protein
MKLKPLLFALLAGTSASCGKNDLVETNYALPAKFDKILLNMRNGRVYFWPDGSGQQLYQSDLTLETVKVADYNSLLPPLANISTSQGALMGVRKSDNVLLHLYQNLQSNTHEYIPFPDKMKGKALVQDRETGQFWSIGMDDKVYFWNAQEGANSAWTPTASVRYAKDIVVFNGIVSIIDRDDQKIYEYFHTSASGANLPTKGVWHSKGNLTAKQLAMNEGIGSLWFLDTKGQAYAYSNHWGTNFNAFHLTCNAKSLAVYGQLPYIISETDGFVYAGMNNNWLKAQLRPL